MRYIELGGFICNGAVVRYIELGGFICMVL